MLIQGGPDRIDARDAHIWWNGDGKVVKVVGADPVQTGQLTRAHYRYGTGAACSAWQAGDDGWRVRAMENLAGRLVADGFEPQTIAREFSKVRQFARLGGETAIRASRGGT